jgi:DNA-binding Xre family transcriptional regulator
MMKWTVKETAEARGFRNAKDLADRAGVPYATIYGVWNGTSTRLDLRTLNTLCKALKASTGLLITYEPDPNEVIAVDRSALVASGKKTKRRV